MNAREAGTIDFAMGGGGRFFLPADMETGGLKGSNADGMILVEKATGLGMQFATDADSFNALDLTSGTPVLALHENSHIRYEVDRTNEPSLAEMTAAAITCLSKNQNGR